MVAPAMSGLSGLGGLVGSGAAGTTLAAPAFAQMASAAQTLEGDADMLSWPADRPLLVDEFGKWIVWVQYFRNADSTKYHVPIVSNDAGATWVLPTLSGFNSNTNGDIVLIRGAFCYDTVNHLMHGCWALTQADGGVYYRQYSFTRDGSNNITGITRTRQMQLEVGVGTSSFESPTAVWVAAASKVVLGWSSLNSAGVAVKGVIRAAALVPVGGAADVLNATWTAPLNENAGAGATDPISSSFPAGQKHSLLAQTAANSQPYVSLALLASGDLGIATAMGGTGGSGGVGSFYWNRAVWASGSSDWRTGLASALASDAGQITLSAMNRSGSGGDNLKHQRLSKIAEASATAVLVSFAAWNGVTDGDVVYAALINPTAGTLTSLTQVYVVGGAHSYAATTDCAWDATAARFLVTYIKTTTQFSYVKTYTVAMATGQAETLLHGIKVDEPYVYESRLNGKTVFYDRTTVAGTLPDKFYGYWAASAWS